MAITLKQAQGCHPVIEAKARGDNALARELADAYVAHSQAVEATGKYGGPEWWTLNALIHRNELGEADRVGGKRIVCRAAAATAAGIAAEEAEARRMGYQD